MLDIQRIRQDTEQVKQGIQNKNVTLDLDPVLKADKQRREIIAEVESLKHERNQVSQSVAEKKRNGEM